jgi:hypothetical protein
MGLLQEIRLINGTYPNVPEPKKEEYSPVFLGIIKRKGYFLMEKSSLANQMDVCLNKSGKNFYIWLKENELNIEETNNYFKIYV